MATQTVRRTTKSAARTDATSTWTSRRVSMHRRPEQERVNAVLFDHSAAEFDDH